MGAMMVGGQTPTDLMSASGARLSSSLPETHRELTCDELSALTCRCTTLTFVLLLDLLVPRSLPQVGQDLGQF